eukprot:scaffold171179_cov14-Tisochrysis_lutea.AAC.1
MVGSRLHATAGMCPKTGRIIRDQNGLPVDEVQGDGVIGKFPILTPGGPEFIYQSCTHLENGDRGFMD